MPRQKSSGRSGGSSRRPTPPVQRPLPPPPPVLPQQQTGGGSIMAGMAGTVAQGVAFGTGSAVAHRAVDAVMGPRSIQHENVEEWQQRNVRNCQIYVDVPTHAGGFFTFPSMRGFRFTSVKKLLQR
ncbi:hypothetical protein BDL97_19G036800 [Sphagnum fallax]|nr:hypothetical protein BDL97_19G036800 [Sphagnum fallax]